MVDPILAPVPKDALVNTELLATYREKMVPKICEEGDDGNHGSTALQDLHCLQTMSTRIYYGLFVAESKVRLWLSFGSLLALLWLSFPLHLD